MIVTNAVIYGDILNVDAGGLGDATPVRLSATKSRMGHAEPAAGAVGIANLATMLGSLASNAIMSLRHVRLQESCSLNGIACGHCNRRTMG